MVQKLLADGRITPAEAELARDISVADDVIVEADSGGHTDNRALVVLLPIMLHLRDTLGTRGTLGYPVRVGAAGGISTPASVASAFQMGAAFVVTGSVNQAAVESGTSARARQMLCQADMADVTMAPAADMFEMGVKLQVLKKGTMFAMRAQKLYDLYRAHESMEAIPADEMKRLETQVFKRSAAEVWADTQKYWQKMDPKQVERALANPKHRMALCFRWYLGLGSRWAIGGDETRSMDYQVWCGPAMGAFNDWVKGTVLDPPEARRIVQIARNLLDGAAAITRAQNARSQGVPVPEEAFQFIPRAYPGA
jgi:PfaD family protein